ncbi:unnamed protein product [Cyprideis torosa]|uniref:Uncharacterized protein n=1 Tax=Cyprideis torosa TaxID=163714 RepID=A0A7R8WKC5_9CRUS|nr:unnamed protein product [Cyprideis torosa]CAG0895918.1 unnamed protein product [Cyprideis torosa]
MFPMDDAAVIVDFSVTLDGRKIKSEVKTVEDITKVYKDAMNKGKTAFKVEENKPDVFKKTVLFSELWDHEKRNPSPIPVPHRTSSASPPPLPHGEILDTPLSLEFPSERSMSPLNYAQAQQVQPSSTVELPGDLGFSSTQAEPRTSSDEDISVSIGNISPGADAVVKISYNTELAVEDGFVRFYLPTTIAPRYIPDESPEDQSEQDIRSAQDMSSQPYSTDSPCPLEIVCSIEAHAPLTSVSSPTHNIIKSAVGNAGQYEVTLSGHTTDMDRDFVLLIESEKPHEPRLMIEEYAENGSTSYAAMLTFVPNFKLPPMEVEIIFLIDRSGSMMGTKSQMAMNALKMFVKSLPSGCYFNIVGFGSIFKTLFPSSVLYDEETTTKAIAYTEDRSENYGGTEILAPLKHIYSQKPIQNFSRQVIVLTDGEVDNTSEVIRCIRQNVNTSRTFAIGLGSDCSHYLVNEIATAGYGTAMFTTLNERLEGKVQQTLHNALQPCMKGTSLSWSYQDRNKTDEEVMSYEDHHNVKPGVEVNGDGPEKEHGSPWKQIPPKVPVIFNGTKFIIYFLSKEGNTMLPDKITVESETPNGPMKQVLQAKTTQQKGNQIHKLAARSLIRYLEESVDNVSRNKKLKTEIISLGLKYGLSSQFTSYVAVDTSNHVVQHAMETRRIATQIPSAWGGGFMNHLTMNHHGMQVDSISFKSEESDGKSWIHEVVSFVQNAFSRNHNKTEVTETGDIKREQENKPFKEASKPKKHNGMTNEQKLQVIVDGQKCNGSFSVNDLPLLKLLGIKSKEDLSEVATMYRLREDLLVTALSLEFLKKFLFSFYPEWKLMSKKAEEWISRNAEEDEKQRLAESIDKHFKEKLHGKNL